MHGDKFKNSNLYTQYHTTVMFTFKFYTVGTWRNFTCTVCISYLDLEINIRDRKFTTAVFDKRDGFSFHTYIVNFPHMDSNIPSKPAYGVYTSQLVRIGRIHVCDVYNSFFY